MKPIIKILAVVVVLILIVSSGYALYSLDTGGQDDGTGGTSDVIPPAINSTTGDTTGTNGKYTTILASFSDNEEVTEAMIFYKSAGDTTWMAGSILSGSFDIKIPSKSDEDWYYYITINDAAGNGPVGDPSTDGSTYYTITVTEDIENLTHTVFIEEATAERCVYCPGVSELIHDMYESGDYNIQYVSLVLDHPNGEKRLEDFNNVAQPTVYLDGGYKVLVGGGKEKEDVDASEYIDAIRTAEERSVPPIKVTVEIEYENGSEDFTTNVVVKNYGEEDYEGTLKVYLAEIISRYNYNDGKPIYHGFLDFIINEKISVDAGEEISKSKDWDLSDLDPENLMVVAAVFSSTSEQRFSFPEAPLEDLKSPFDAYFCDASDGITLIEGGNLPPRVAISNPTERKVHIFGIPLFKSVLKVTRLIGPTKITANATDDGEIEKVEFYVDGKLVFTDEEAPYEYKLKRIGLFKSLLFRKHTIEVIAYDDTGKTSSDSMEVKARL